MSWRRDGRRVATGLAAALTAALVMTLAGHEVQAAPPKLPLSGWERLDTG